MLFIKKKDKNLFVPEILDKEKARKYSLTKIINDIDNYEEKRLSTFYTNNKLIEDLYEEIIKDYNRDTYPEYKELLINVRRYIESKNVDLNENIKDNFRCMPKYNIEEMATKSYLINVVLRGYLVGFSVEQIQDFKELEPSEKQEILDNTFSELSFYHFLHTIPIHIKDIYEITEYLVKKGAKLNRIDSSGETPISCALSIEVPEDADESLKKEILDYKFKIIELLLKNKEKPNVIIDNFLFNKGNYVQIGKYYNNPQNIIDLFLQKGVEDKDVELCYKAPMYKYEKETEDSSGRTIHPSKIGVPFNEIKTPYNKRNRLATKDDIINFNVYDAYKEDCYTYLEELRSDNPFLNVLYVSLFDEDLNIKEELDKLIKSGYDFLAPIEGNYLIVNPYNPTYLPLKTYPIHILSAGYLYVFNEDLYESICDEDPDDLKGVFKDFLDDEFEPFGGIKRVQNKMFPLCTLESLNTKTVKVFLDYILSLGADINQLDYKGMTPLDLALYYGRFEDDINKTIITEYLCSHGAKYNQYVTDFSTPSYDYDFDYSKDLSNRPIKSFINVLKYNNEIKLIKTLLAAGLSKNDRAEDGYNLLSAHIEDLLFEDVPLNDKVYSSYINDLIKLGFDKSGIGDNKFILEPAFIESDLDNLKYLIEVIGISTDYTSTYKNLEEYAEDYDAEDYIIKYLKSISKKKNK